MKRLLLVEDEDVIRRALTRFLERRGLTVTGVSTVEAAVRAQPRAFDAVLVDVRLPGADGTDLIALADPVPVVVMTSHASVRSAVEAMRRGAADYIAKPFDHDELLLVLERAVRHHRRDAENRALRRELARERPLHRLLEGTSLEGLVERASIALEAASGSVPPRVFVHGEPGCGREAVARGLHERLRGDEAPFVVVDVPLLDATERCADQLRASVHDARHGTLAVRHDELLSPADRAALVADSRASNAMFVAIGTAPRTSDDTASGADRDPCDAVLAVPALRERRGDAVILAHRSVRAVAARHARPDLTLAPEAIAWVGARDWPGNVTELDRTVQQAAVAVAGTTDHLVGIRALARAAVDGTPPGRAAATEAMAGAAQDAAPIGGSAYAPDLDEYFRWFVLAHQGALSETALAARLGISRKSLWERRQRSGLLRETRTGEARGAGPDDP